MSALRLCVSVLCTDGDRALLVRTQRGWELPGGKRQESECWRDALCREFDEETGLPLTILPGAVLALDWTPADGAQCESVVLVARGTTTGEPTPRKGDSVLEARWFHRDAIPWESLSALPSAQALREWAAEQRQPWARLKERLAGMPELRDLVRETEARLLDMHHGYQRAQEGREAAEKQGEGLRRLVKQAETLRADYDALQAAALEAAKQMGEGNKKLVVLNACVDRMHGMLATASRNGSRLATDLEQERQARIEADGRVIALGLDLLARERERDTALAELAHERAEHQATREQPVMRENERLRARLAAFTGPIDVDAEVERLRSEIGMCGSTPAIIEVLRPHVEREAQLRSALAAAEERAEDVRQFLGAELQKAAHTEIDLLGKLAEVRKAVTLIDETIERAGLVGGAGLHERVSLLIDRCRAAEERGAKLDAMKVAEVERVLDRHREAFGVQPPLAPSEEDAEERGVPADDPAAVAALAGVDPPQDVMSHKCALPTCEEIVTDGKDFCSLACENMGDDIEAEKVPAGTFDMPSAELLRAAEQKLARLVSLAQALFAAQRGDRATAAYEASEAMRVYVEAIAGDVPPMLTEERARWMARDVRSSLQSGDVFQWSDERTERIIAAALLRVSRGERGPASEPSRMAQAACAAFVESDAAATAEEIAQAARESLSGCETVTTWAEQLARRQAADEPAAEMAVTTGLDVASVGDAEGVAALVGLDAPADTVGDEP